jgi:hypothetical protein
MLCRSKPYLKGKRIIDSAEGKYCLESTNVSEAIALQLLRNGHLTYLKAQNSEPNL